MKQTILLFLILLVEAVALYQWSRCGGFKWHYSSYDLQLRLIADIHGDGNAIPLWQTRLFHNKIVGTILDTFNIYLAYWDIVFLAKMISLSGMLGVLMGLYFWF